MRLLKPSATTCFDLMVAGRDPVALMYPDCRLAVCAMVSVGTWRRASWPGNDPRTALCRPTRSSGRAFLRMTGIGMERNST